MLLPGAMVVVPERTADDGAAFTVMVRVLLLVVAEGTHAELLVNTQVIKSPFARLLSV